MYTGGLSECWLLLPALLGSLSPGDEPPVLPRAPGHPGSEDQRQWLSCSTGHCPDRASQGDGTWKAHVLELSRARDTWSASYEWPATASSSRSSPAQLDIIRETARSAEWPRLLSTQTELKLKIKMRLSQPGKPEPKCTFGDTEKWPFVAVMVL